MKPSTNTLKIEQLPGLGTYWWVEIFDEKKPEQDVVFDHICSVIDGFDAQYSRFKETSLIGRLNKERSIENPPEELLQMLAYGISLHVRTEGAFNMCIGHILENRGYDALYSFENKGASEEICTPPDALFVSPDKVTLSCGNVDFGGFGKGFLIDKLAKSFHEELEVHHFLINGGGDMYVTSNHGEPFEILLEHPLEPGKYIHKIHLKHQGFGASNTLKRKWKEKNTDTDRSHIIDLRDTEAISSIASYTVAEIAREADAFATVASILGNDRERMGELFQKNNVEALLVFDGKLTKSPGFPDFIE